MKRLAASVAIAARDRDFDPGSRRSAVLAAVSEYRQAMAMFATVRNVDVWYARLDVASIAQRLAGSTSVK